MNKGVLVLGSFGYHNNQLDGQTIKTRQVYELLKNNYRGRVEWFCSMLLKTKPYLFFVLFWRILKCKTIVVLYASSGGFQTMLPKIYKIAKIFSKDIIYIAIGSTQIDCIEGKGQYTQKRDDLLFVCKNIKAFLAETVKVQSVLEKKYGFNNVDLFPNFRCFNERIPFYPASRDVLRLVFMSRITHLKGFDTIFNFIEYVKNDDYDIIVDFYGPLDGICNEDFLRKIEKYKDFGVDYKGVLQSNEIYETLVKYDVMLHPTLVDGIPGSIIDAYISSLAIVATNWEYAHEIINDGVNGFIVAYDNPKKQEEFNERIIRLYNDRELLERMKYNAFQTRRKYSSEESWRILKKYL